MYEFTHAVLRSLVAVAGSSINSGSKVVTPISRLPFQTLTLKLLSMKINTFKRSKYFCINIL